METTYTTRYYVSSWAGLIVAGIAGIAATSIIVQDAFPNGWADWSHVKLEHWLAPVLVGITAFLWLHAARELREWRLGAIPLAAVATVCSGLIVFESMGRGAEALDTKIKVAEVSEEQRLQAALSLQHARERLAEVDPIRRSECAGAPEPLPIDPKRWPNCRKYRGSVEAYEASIARLEKKLETVAPVPVDARGERVAFLAGLAGYDGEVAKKAAQSLYPLARPLAFEFVMILLLHASVRTREVKVVEAKAVEVEASPETKMLSFESENGDRPSEEIDELKKLFGRLAEVLAKADGLNNQELASLAGLSPGHMSRLRQKLEAAGYVASEKVGKEVRTRLVARDGVRVAA